jgi:fluoride exporter
MRPFLAQLLLVGAGGFIGSALRFAIGGGVHRWLPMTTFPYGTLAVNVLGCLAVGVLTGLADARQVLNASQRVFLLIGVLGGFTTFSTFAYETLALAQDSDVPRALANVLLQVVLGLGAAWLGWAAARYLAA